MKTRVLPAGNGGGTRIFQLEKALGGLTGIPVKRVKKGTCNVQPHSGLLREIVNGVTVIDPCMHVSQNSGILVSSVSVPYDVKLYCMTSQTGQPIYTHA